MVKYCVKRILLSLLILLGVSLILYTLVWFMPADYLYNQAITAAGTTGNVEEIYQELRAYYGLDGTMFQGYFGWLWDFLRGDFGISYRTQQPIINEFKTRLPISITLAFTSLTLAACIGIPLGVLSAVKQYSLLDTIPSVMALTLSAVPSFWFGMMLIYFLAYRLGLFPSYGMGGLEHWVLPTLTIAVVYAAEILRYTRSSMLETIRADYVRTARAKGVAERTVIWKHAMKNGLLPVVTLLGSSFGAQIGGAIVTENLYNLPGLGTLTLLSINMRDTPTVVATSVIFATLYNIILILVDLMYAFIDPRIKAKYSR